MQKASVDGSEGVQLASVDGIEGVLAARGRADTGVMLTTSGDSFADVHCCHGQGGCLGGDCWRVRPLSDMTLFQPRAPNNRFQANEPVAHNGHKDVVVRITVSIGNAEASTHMSSNTRNAALARQSFETARSRTNCQGSTVQ